MSAFNQPIRDTIRPDSRAAAAGGESDEAGPRQPTLSRPALAARHLRQAPKGASLTAAGLALVAVLASIGLASAAAADQSRLDAAVSGNDAVTVSQAVAGGAPFEDFAQQAGSPVQARLGAYVGSPALYAESAPLVPMMDNEATVPHAATAQRPTAAYLPALSAHVRLIAGTMPAEQGPGLDLRGMDALAATMSQAAADGLGLNLSDHFCADLGPPGAEPAMGCFHLIGVWRPLNAADPYWSQAGGGTHLMLGRSDFATLVTATMAGEGAHVRATYSLRREQLRPDRAADLASRLAALRAELATRPGVELTRSPETALARFVSSRATMARAYAALAGGLYLLALCCLVAAIAAFLKRLTPGAQLLAERGWSRPRLAALVGTETALVALPAVLVGVAAGLIGSGWAGMLMHAQGGWPIAWLSGVLPWAGLGLAAAGLAVAALAAVAATMAARPRQTDRPPATRRTVGRWAGAGMMVLGLALVGLSGLAGPAAWLAALAGAAALAAGSTWLLPIAARIAQRVGGGLATRLATASLSRRPGEHTAAVVIIVLAAALAVLAGLTAVLDPSPTAALPAWLMAAAVIAVGLAGLALQAAAGRASRSRPDAIVANVPRRAVRRASRLRLALVLAQSLLVGLLLGGLLAAALLSGDVDGPASSGALGHASGIAPALRALGILAAAAIAAGAAALALRMAAPGLRLPGRHRDLA